MQGSRNKSLAAVCGILLLLFCSACGGQWIRVQNVGSGPAVVVVTHLDADGRVVTQESLEIAPGAAANFLLDENDRLPGGHRGSSLIESNQPIVAIRQADRSGQSADMVDGETLSMRSGGGSLYLPMVMNRAEPFQSWSSRINIQNLNDTAVACVTITYVSAETGSIVAYDPSKPGEGQARPGCPRGGMPLAPRATLFRDPTNLGVPAGFNGAAYISTVVNAQSTTATVSATVDNTNDAFNLMTTYAGLNTVEMGRTALLPLVEREVGRDGSFSTRFTMQGNNPAQSVTAQVHFEGVDGGGNFVSRDGTVTFKGARSCTQTADGAANCLATGDSLPPGFTGWARISASAPIGVVVQRGSYFGGFGNYAALSESTTSTALALPAVQHGSFVRVLVAGGGPANVRIRYFGLQLPGGQQATTVSVNGTGTIFNANQGLPGGFDGSAIIESDRPIAAVASYNVGGGGPDREFLYNAVPIR